MIFSASFMFSSVWGVTVQLPCVVYELVSWKKNMVDKMYNVWQNGFAKIIIKKDGANNYGK